MTVAPHVPADASPSNGYEAVAEEFMRHRERCAIGVEVLQAWTQHLPCGARVLDLGCGSGAPVAEHLSEAGFAVFGIDASPTLVRAFRQRLPRARVACESIEDSRFFDLRFDGVVAIGLLFLLAAEAQRALIGRAAAILHPGGRLLFTAPTQRCVWRDTLTGRESRSLGASAYLAAMLDAGLVLGGEYTDAGGNHYFDAVRPLV